jgi:ABC-2 type transport system permease protein
VVATVLKLRYRVLGNTLARRPWQLVGFILGSLWGLGILGGLVTALIALSIFQNLEVATVVSVLGGSALILGWLVGPIIIAGLDSTVDAVRLAPFPLTRRQVMLALAGTGLTGIPGIVTTVAALATLIVWVRWPVAAVVAVPTVLLGVLTCVLASRLMGELSGGMGGRRSREIIGTVVLVVLIMTGPILTGVAALLDQAGGDLWTRIQQAAGILAWTPLGAAWSVAPSVAAGQWLPALASTAIAIATLVVLWIVWDRVIETAVSSPRQRATRAVAAGKLGLFGVMPTGGVGATWARSLSGWLRDPRYLRQLIVIPLFPVLFAFTGGTDGFMFLISPVLAALVMAAVGYADVSFDGTAFGTTLATGISGRADRLGRLLGAACVGIPLILVIAVATAVVAGDAAHLPAVLGAALGVLLAGYGACAVSSALIVTPVPAPGDSPFKSTPGQNSIVGLLVFVVWAAVIALSLPAIVPAIVNAVTGDAMWGWIALAVGVVFGAVVAIVGVLVGGRTLERTGPDLLVRIKSFPT